MKSSIYRLWRQTLFRQLLIIVIAMIIIACSREDVGEPDQRDYSDLERYATQTSVIIRTTE